MQILYRYSKNFTREDVAKLSSLGVVTSPGFQTIFLVEGQENWIAIKNLFDEWAIMPIVELSHSLEEQLQAEYLIVTVQRVHGYPQPENSADEIKPYLKGVYSLENYNPDFGAPKGPQIGSIRVKQSPKIGSFDFMQLHWLYDVLLVKKAIYDQHLKDLEIGYIPLIEMKTNRPIESIVQLKVQGIAKSQLDLKDTEVVKNTFMDKKTGVLRYQLTGRRMPAFLSDPGKMHFFESQEYFGGDGAASNKLLIVSQKFFRIVHNNGLRGLNFFPT